MFPKILTEEQIELLPLVKKFSDAFYLVGGTAVALQLGHRRSIDFDLFSDREFANDNLLAKVRRFYPVDKVYVKSRGQMTIDIHGVRMTWYQFPFIIPHRINWEEIIWNRDKRTNGAGTVELFCRR